MPCVCVRDSYVTVMILPVAFHTPGASTYVEHRAGRAPSFPKTNVVDNMLSSGGFFFFGASYSWVTASLTPLGCFV